MGVSLSLKKEEKELEPQYYLSAVNTPVYNYRVYYMSTVEKILTFLAAFVIGAAVGYLFYGGIGKDEFGQPTMVTYVLDILIPCIVGFVAGYFFVPMRTKSIIKKNKTMISKQFKDMLDGLTTSLGAGKNVPDAFKSVYDDLSLQYSEGAFILQELEVINNGIINNIPIESLLEDFAARADNDDILSFASVFSISYRKGGNIKDIIRSTHKILSEKMAIADEIETLVTSNKLEQNAMVVMPVAIIFVIKTMSPDFGANFVTPTGLMSTTFALVIFAVSYVVGRNIMDIKL